MKRILSLLCCAVLTATAAGCAAQNTAPEPTTVSAETTAAPAAADLGGLAETFAQDVAATGFTGMVYAAQNGEKLFESASTQDYDADTVYYIASVSKQFTAAAVLLLAEEGKLSVDDTLDKYFPDYKGGDTVKVHHLLCMRSGIADYTDAAQDGSLDPADYNVRPDNTAAENRAAILKWILTETAPAPDIAFQYCNSNYFLLGEIIEQAAGMPYEDYIQEKILTPLHMEHTGFSDTWDKDLPVAEGYDSTGTSFVGYKGSHYACGDMMSTAKDLVIWANEFITGKNQVLSDAILAQMCENYEYGGYGYGVMPDENRGMVYHAGSLPPFSSHLRVDPATGFVLVLFDNTDDTAINQAVEKLVGDYTAARNS